MADSRFRTPVPRQFGKFPAWTCLIALLVLVASSTALAQTSRSNEDVDSPGLTVEAIAGWDGTVDRSMPVPVSFLIRNDSDRIIEGQLRLYDTISGHDVTLGEVVVAPGTARRVTSVRAMTGWYECYAALNDGRRVLWRREMPLATGNEFDANVNFALFINDGGRRLQLPDADSDTTATPPSESVVTGEQGRPVRFLTVKTWQVPNHPGPLVAAQAIVFSEGAADTDLNQVQWRAVAEWMCQGGAVFVHADSREILNQLTHAAPLDAEPAVESDQFTIRRVGLGAIYEYPHPLLPSESSGSRQLIAEAVARLNRNHINALTDAGFLYNRRGGRADLNRVLIVTFFSFYTLLSGVVALLLFRLTRQRITAYTVFVVLGASVLSGLLGWYLRFSRGELRWMTITQAGAGGCVQVGRIEVQSAGGRNTHAAITGERPDLQFVGGEQGYYSWNWGWRQLGYPPFTWQPDLATDVDNTYQIHVPMTPWGRRRLHATAYKRGLPPLDFKLEFTPRVRPGEGEAVPASPPSTSGSFSVTIVNHLPFDITECRLVIAAADPSSLQAASMQSAPATTEAVLLPSGSFQVVTSPADGSIDLLHMREMQHLPSGTTIQVSFDADFQAIRNDWERNIQFSRGSLTLPDLSGSGNASAWIIGRIQHSPGMTIDGQRSDFDPHEHLHIFIQQILPEDMPQLSVFPDSQEAAAPDPDSN